MVAFFGTIIAVNFTMATLASGTWTGLVVKNSYVASQKFNGELAEAQRQENAGLHSRISHADDTLSFTILNRQGNVIFPTSASLWIGRPAFEQEDRTVKVKCNDKGVCSGQVSLQPGPWAMRIDAILSQEAYRRDARLFVAENGTVRVDD